MKNELKIIVLFFGFILAQDQDEPQKTSPFTDYQISSERYMTNAEGNIMMSVNIWGHVGSPGSHIVYEGIDFASLISVVGGPRTGANLRQVRIYREVPDEDGILFYHLNLNKFIDTGDRSEFIKIKPNDTIIIPQKLSSYILQQAGTMNILLSLINLYFQVSGK